MAPLRTQKSGPRFSHVCSKTSRGAEVGIFIFVQTGYATLENCGVSFRVSIFSTEVYFKRFVCHETFATWNIYRFWRLCHKKKKTNRAFILLYWNQCRIYLNADTSLLQHLLHVRIHFSPVRWCCIVILHPPQWLFDCSLLGTGVLNLSRRWWWMYLCVFYGTSMPVKCSL